MKINANETKDLSRLESGDGRWSPLTVFPMGRMGWMGGRRQ